MNNDDLFRQALQRQNDRIAEMKMSDDMEQRVMERIKRKTNHRRWLYPLSIGAVAASVVLLLTLHINNNVEEQTVVGAKPEPVVAAVTPTPKAETPEIVQSPPPTPPVEKRKRVAKAKVAEIPEVAEIPDTPDTLGNTIWHNKENVERALQMLAELETTIQREEQEIRNNIIEVSFRATPQPANTILVTNEAGDYEVIENTNIIEI